MPTIDHGCTSTALLPRTARPTRPGQAGRLTCHVAGLQACWLVGRAAQPPATANDMGCGPSSIAGAAAGAAATPASRSGRSGRSSGASCSAAAANTAAATPVRGVMVTEREDTDLGWGRAQPANMRAPPVPMKLAAEPEPEPEPSGLGPVPRQEEEARVDAVWADVNTVQCMLHTQWARQSCLPSGTLHP